MNVIHIVNDVTQINLGIWNAALLGSSHLKEKHGVNTFFIICHRKKTEQFEQHVPYLWADGLSFKQIQFQLNELSYENGNTIIVTHGCWQKATRLGHQFRKHGYRWIYTPHGMLEPWSLKNNWLKKKIYFEVFERRKSRQADLVRAVSPMEALNLKALLKREIEIVGNGVTMPEQQSKPSGKIQFLFMARLHFKKGITPLVRAWSKTMREADAKLVIAGPDEGELEKIRSLLFGNIEYIGPVYGDDKSKVLERSHYYLLPSQSEGFPTSVVEAMGYGLIPIISPGCNFPEVYEHQLGYRIEPSEKSLILLFNEIKEKAFDHKLSQRNYDFIQENYSEEAIGDKLYSMYAQLMK